MEGRKRSGLRDYDGISVMALPYTFLGKTKMADGHFWVFVARSSAIAYFRTSPPLRHSTVGVLMAVKVSWRFGCAHASSSRRTVINSSLCVKKLNVPDHLSSPIKNGGRKWTGDETRDYGCFAHVKYGNLVLNRKPGTAT